MTISITECEGQVNVSYYYYYYYCTTVPVLEMTPYTLIHGAGENYGVRKCKARTAILSLATVGPLPTAPHVVETTT